MACINDTNFFNNDPNKVCRELNGGILDNYLYITSDPYQTTIFTMILAHIALIIIYINLVKNNPTNNVILSLLFVSPAINFLTFQGNIDILFMIFCFFLFYNSKKLRFISSVIIFILSLYKIHLIAGIAALVIYSIKNQDREKVILNTIFLLISTYFAFLEFLRQILFPL